MKKTKKQKIIWFLVALLAVFLAGPNNTLLKFALHEVGPLWVSLSRFVILAVILLPALYFGRKGINEKSFKYSVVAGIAYSSAVLSIAGSIFYSQASYPALIGISSPIIMMLYSVLLTHERVSHKSFFGITLAAIGGFLIVFLPILLGGKMGGSVSPIATILALINAVASPLMYVMTKKSVDAGMTVWTSLGVVAWVGIALVGVVALGLNLSVPPISSFVQPGVIFPIAYAVICAMLLSRGMTTLAFKRLGSAPIAGLEYLGVFLAVIIPVLALGERLSVEMVLGGALILTGVVAIELKYTPKWLKKRKTYLSGSTRSTIN